MQGCCQSALQNPMVGQAQKTLLKALLLCREILKESNESISRGCIQIKKHLALHRLAVEMTPHPHRLLGKGWRGGGGI